MFLNNFKYLKVGDVKILLMLDENFNLNREKLKFFLSSNCQHLKFTIFEKHFELTCTVLTKPDSFNVIYNQYENEFTDFDKVFVFTNIQFIDNYFIHEHNDLLIFSFADWDMLTNLPKSNGLIYFIACYFALDIDSSKFRHEKTTGCIYDFLGDKRGIDAGMRRAGLCPNCLKRITESIANDKTGRIFEDIKNLMNLLSSSSKWNNDIFESIRVEKSSALNKRKLKSKAGISIVIASPGDTQTERQLLLSTLERRFRTDNHEEHCGYRIMVNGWEDLASQNGYPQDVINKTLIENADFVIAVFKYKLGSPTYDQGTGSQRAESGTAEELLQALDNSNTENPIGMAYFLSTAPVISLDAPNFQVIVYEWKRLNQFKEKISSKLIYKPYTEPNELLNIILKDLEQNIKNYIIK